MWASGHFDGRQVAQLAVAGPGQVDVELAHRADVGLRLALGDMLAIGAREDDAAGLGLALARPRGGLQPTAEGPLMIELGAQRGYVPRCVSIWTGQRTNRESAFGAPSVFALNQRGRGAAPAL